MADFVKLTGIAYRSTDTEYRYTFYINMDKVESILPEEGYTKIFMIGDENPYHVAEHHETIMKMC